MIRNEHAPVTIVRPGWIYGPRDGASFARLARTIESGRMAFVGPGDNHLPLIYARDAALGAVLAAEAAGADGRCYLLVNDEPVTQRDFIAEIATQLGVKPPARSIPYELALKLGTVAERMARLAGARRPPPVMRYGMQLLGGETSSRSVEPEASWASHLRCGWPRGSGGAWSGTEPSSGGRWACDAGPHHRWQRLRGETPRHGPPRPWCRRQGARAADRRHELARATLHRRISGDVRRPESLAEPMRGVDQVLHLAAMMDVWRPLEDYRAVNVEGTVNVCRAALAARVSRLVHMSSSSVYGVGLGRPADETFPLAPFPDPYPVTKAAGDTAVRRMIVEDRLPR